MSLSSSAVSHIALSLSAMLVAMGGNFGIWRLIVPLIAIVNFSIIPLVGFVGVVPLLLLVF